MCLLSKCSCHWRYLRQQQVVFYSQFHQLLQLCFDSLISTFLPFPSGGRKRSWSARQDLACTSGAPCKRPPSCFLYVLFFFWVSEQNHSHKCESLTRWLPAVVRQQISTPLQPHRQTLQPALGGWFWSWCWWWYKAWIRMSCFGAPLGLPSSFSPRSSFAACTQQWCADSHCQHRGT